MGNVLVVIEQRENVIQTVSLELLGKATEIAKDYDTKVSALLLGSKVEGLIDTLAHYRVSCFYCFISCFCIWFSCIHC